jgi:hydrogenase maturation factor HypF (carbamoyltransferase family)
MTIDAGTGRLARRILVRGVVQGVGFRPFVFRLARTHALDGWVLNGDAGVQIHVEGHEQALEAFIRELQSSPPRAARIAEITIEADGIDAVGGFEIRQSASDRRPTTRVSPDLPVCDACLQELFDPSDRRYLYPYINCTNCGPRFSIVRACSHDDVRLAAVFCMRRRVRGSRRQTLSCAAGRLCVVWPAVSACAFTRKWGPPSSGPRHSG